MLNANTVSFPLTDLDGWIGGQVEANVLGMKRGG